VTDCPHDWVTDGPFYIDVALDEVRVGRRQRFATVQIEYCRLCGVLRLPEKLWWQDGSVADRPRSMLRG